MLNDLAGKAVLVTGGSVGIGAATARAFADAGARVAIHYNTSEAEAAAVAAEITAKGGTAIVVGGDLADRATARAVVEQAAEALGRLDIVVNNAGAMVQRMPFRDLTEELYDRVMAVNVGSVIAVSQAAIPHLEKQGGGAIVNVGSIAGSDGGGPGSGHYGAAKAYVHNLTRHMARDLAKSNIRVNAIAPGVIGTRFHAATPPERMEAMKNAVQLGRIGTPEDCAGPILFLASGSLSGYVTGQILHVNGGQYMP